MLSMASYSMDSLKIYLETMQPYKWIQISVKNSFSTIGHDYNFYDSFRTAIATNSSALIVSISEQLITSTK